MKFILILLVFCNFAFAKVFIKESRFLYRGEDYIGSLHFLQSLTEESKEKLLKEIRFTYKDISIEVKERDQNYFKYLENRYYFGNHNKMNLIANFINYPNNASVEFSKHICEIIPCDFIYRGNYISGYSFNKISLPRTQDYNYYFINRDATFNFDKSTPPLFMDMVLAENNSDVSYTGEKGEVLFYKPDHDDEKFDPMKGIFLVKGKNELYIASDYRFTNYMKAVINLTDSDCILYRQDEAYYQCRRNKEIDEGDISDLGEYVRVYYPSGNIKLEMEEEFLRDIFIDLNKKSSLSHAYNDKKITVLKRDYKKSESGIKKNLEKLKLVYKKDQYLLVTAYIDGVSKENRDILHETITKYTDANILEIYRVNSAGDLLLSKNSIQYFDEYNKLHENKIFQDYKTLYYGVDVLSNEITASSDHSYLQRKKTPHISLIDANYTWLPSRRSWGMNATLQYYNVTNSAVDSFGSTDEVAGSILKFSASALLRKLLRKEKKPTTVVLGAGMDLWDYKADANNAIGSLSLTMAHFFYNVERSYKQFDLRWGLKGGVHLQVDQEFSAKNDLGKPLGMFAELRGEIIYPVNKKLDLSAGAKYGYHKISSSEVQLVIKELSFMMGLTWSFDEK